MGIEMIFIFLLALILFGPKKLPEIGREVGRFMAEFKRASNEFTSQLTSEIEKSAADSANTPHTGAQQTSSFAQTLLPPAVTSTLSEIDSARDRLMKTARMAFDAQNFTLRPPEPAAAASEPAETPAAAEAPAQIYPETISATDPYVSPVAAVTGQPTPDAAPAPGNSAPQSS